MPDLPEALRPYLGAHGLFAGDGARTGHAGAAFPRQLDRPALVHAPRVPRGGAADGVCAGSGVQECADVAGASTPAARGRPCLKILLEC